VFAASALPAHAFTQIFTPWNQSAILGAMNPPAYLVRRATLDDLPVLRPLWQEASLSVIELEKRLTDFQVVLDNQGRLLAAIGLRISGSHGQIHSEVFADPAHADLYRDEIWERLGHLAHNHGLVRLWTQEDVPFWQHTGFAFAPEETLAQLPAAFRGQQGRWLTLKLRDEVAQARLLEQEFELFIQAQRSDSDRVLRQARILKGIATALAILLVLFVLVLAFYVWRRHPSVALPR
jgi:N-acetylglutamate synthase-like GNAT family acetyltransferase